MEDDIMKIKSVIENSFSTFLGQLSDNDVDVDHIEMKVIYNDGFHYLEIKS